MNHIFEAAGFEALIIPTEAKMSYQYGGAFPPAGPPQVGGTFAAAMAAGTPQYGAGTANYGAPAAVSTSR